MTSLGLWMKRINSFMNTKIEEFIRRSKHRNAHLYSDTMQEGFDYVVCPVTYARMSMIKSSYIECILGMTVEEYDTRYPGIQKIAQKRKANISAGLKQIDPDSGKTKYEISQEKSRAKLSVTNSDGISGYKKLGQKTRTTHMSRIDESGRNGYQRQAHARVTTVLENGLTVEQNAHIKLRETLLAKGITRVVGASAISKKILKPLIDFLDEKQIKYYFDKTEYAINDGQGNYYYYDLTVPDFSIVIEYQSNAWHADPCMNEDAWSKWKTPKGKVKSSDEVLARDYKKAKTIYEHRGFHTYYVWENTQQQDVETLLCLLKTQNTKY
jgi:hypothetical protein